MLSPFAITPSTADASKLSERALNKEIMSQLEDELFRVFAGTKEEGTRKHTERVKRKQALFVNEVRTEVNTEDRISGTLRRCAISYMINMGEMAILQKRINRLREMRKVFSDCRDVLRGMVMFYDDTVDFLMKYIAKAIGFVNSSAVIDRVIALRSVKAESMIEQEHLNDAYSRVNEQHLLIKNTLGKRNLLLNNQRAELGLGLRETESMAKEFGKSLQEAMTSSCDSSRLLFQITNQIDSIHDSVTNARGYTSHAETVFEKLSEISERVSVLSQALKAAMEKTTGVKQTKPIRQSIGSSSDGNNNLNINNLTSNNATRFVFNAHTNTNTNTISNSTSTTRKPGKKIAARYACARIRFGGAAPSGRTRGTTTPAADSGGILMASANDSEQCELFTCRSANNTNPAASPFTEESAADYDDRSASRRKERRNETVISVNGNSGCGNGVVVCPEIRKAGGTFHSRQGKSPKAQQTAPGSSNSSDDKKMTAIRGEQHTARSCSRRSQGIVYGHGSQGPPASPINVVARKNSIHCLPTIV